MLWDIIRDFFVKNFFGGYLSTGTAVYCKLGSGRFFTSPTNSVYTIDFPVSVGNEFLTLGDWLSTTFTLVSFVLVFILMVLFIKWIFKVVSNTLLLR